MDEMGDAMGEDARLPGACAGDDEQRPFGVLDRLALRLVKDGKVGLRLGDGHSSMLAATAAVAPRRAISHPRTLVARRGITATRPPTGTMSMEAP